MSVPKNFRKSTEIPSNLCLHFVDEIPPSDIETGKDTRSQHRSEHLSDVIQHGTTQHEQIELAIVDLAIHKHHGDGQHFQEFAHENLESRCGTAYEDAEHAEPLYWTDAVENGQPKIGRWSLVVSRWQVPISFDNPNKWLRTTSDQRPTTNDFFHQKIFMWIVRYFLGF